MNNSWIAFSLSVVVGIGTGVTANLVTYLFVNIWLPAYRDYVYKDVRVDGDWTILQSEIPLDGEALSTTWVLSATLEQKAHVVKGTATATCVKDGTSADVIDYKIEGHIYNRFVSITFRPRDKARIAYSTFLLEVKGDGTRMKGYRSFYGLRKEIIRAVECTWRRGIHEADCRTHTNTEAA